MIDPAPDPSARARVGELADAEGKLEQLLRSESWGAEQRLRWQRQRIERLLAAANEIPLWAERLQGVAGPAGLAGVAPLTREQLRSEQDRLAGDAELPAVVQFSSGSSGRPVSVRLGAEQLGFAAAGRLRQLCWFGQPTGEVSQANILGRPGDDGRPLRRTASSPPQFAINPWSLDAATLEAAHREIVESGGVRLIGANTSMFVKLAELYMEAGLDGRELGCELGIVGSELTDGGQRETIERVFGCRTAEMYGAKEAPMIAAECPSGSLHVNEDAYLVEILGESGEALPVGRLGSVTVTHLHNVEMPLIRYQLGDAAAFRETPCPCGRTLAPLSLEVGHLEEMVLKRDGTMVHPGFIRNVYEAAIGAGLRAFHTEQEAPGDFVTYIDSDDLGDGVAERCRAGIEETLAEPVRLRLVVDAELARARLPNGKLRTFTRSC